jgi:SPP1 gp7 family putative phage head morphogenesis protein
MAKSVADSIEGKFISHAVDLSRFEEEMRQKVLYNLKLLEQELVRDIESGLGTAYTQTKLRALKAQTKASISTAYEGAYKEMEKASKDLARLESTFVGDAVNSSVGVNLMTTTLLPKQLQSLASSNMIFGAPSKEFWKQQSTNLQDKFMAEMRLGISRGEPLNQLTQRVRGKATGKRTAYKTRAGKQRYMVEFKGGIMDVQTRDAQALIQTSVQQVANDVRHKTLKDNDDVIKGQAWLSTLDTRTTPYCQAMDGLEWGLDGKPLGGHSEPFSPPPAHWRCRSTLVPILKSWAELSKTKSPELKKKLTKLEKNIPPSTRASMGGPVSEKLSYKNWFNKQPEHVKLDILGPGKLAIYNRGNLSFRDMIDQRGNPLTIKELEARAGRPSKVPGQGFDDPMLDATDLVINAPESLAQIETPEFLFHVTERKNAKAIKKDGLVKGKNRVDDVGETGSRTYLTNDPYGITDSPGYEDLDLVAVKVKTKGLKLRLDPEYYPEFTADEALEFATKKVGYDGGFYGYTYGKIPKSAIDDIVETADVGPLVKVNKKKTVTGITNEAMDKAKTKALIQYDADAKGIAAYEKAMKLESKSAKEMLVRESSTKESALQEMYEARIALEGVTDTKSLYFDKTTDSWTTERLALHEKLAVEIAANGKVSKNPEFMMTGGYPGSGKSSILNKIFPGWKDKYVHLDSDRVKELLSAADDLQAKGKKVNGKYLFKNYDKMLEAGEIDKLGWRAAQYHREADYILKRAERIAVDQRKHILFDGTMKNSTKSDLLVADYIERGYKTKAVFADLPLEKSVERAVGRFLGEEARFVDPAYIVTHGKKNIASFGRIKEIADEWYHYSTDVPYKAPPILKGQGKNAVLKLTKELKEEVGGEFLDQLSQMGWTKDMYRKANHEQRLKLFDKYKAVQKAEKEILDKYAEVMLSPGVDAKELADLISTSSYKAKPPRLKLMDLESIKDRAEKKLKKEAAKKAVDAKEAAKKAVPEKVAKSSPTSKSIKEAEEWAKANLPFVRNVDYSLLSLHDANKVNRAMNGLSDRYGNFINKFDLGGFKGTAGGQFHYTDYFLSDKTAKMGVNVDYVKLRQKTRTKLNKEYDKETVRIKEQLRRNAEEIEFEKFSKKNSPDYWTGEKQEYLDSLTERRVLIKNAFEERPPKTKWVHDKMTWDNLGLTYEDVAIHEYAHAIEADLFYRMREGLPIDAKLKKFLEGMKEKSDYKKWDNSRMYWGADKGGVGKEKFTIWDAGRTKHARSVSKYAMADGSEYFAESFLKYTRTGKLEDKDLQKLFDMLIAKKATKKVAKKIEIPKVAKKVVDEGKLTESIYPTKLDEVIEEFTSDDVFFQVADDKFMSEPHFYEELFGSRAKTQKAIQKHLDNSSVYMAIDSNTLRSQVILKDGKFKNSMETKKGTFKTIGEDRAKKERDIFGITAEVDDVDNWPKYGFLSDADEMSYENIVGFGYGDAYVKFKKNNILKRTTITLGNSYDGNTYRVNPSTGKKEMLRVAPVTKMDAPDEKFFIGVSKMGPDAPHFKKMKTSVGVDDVAKFGTYGTYIEAQMYGKLMLGDVSEIFVESKKKMKAIEKALVKMKITHIKVKPVKYDTRLKGIWEGEYDGPGARYAASITPADLDRLGDPWIDNLSKRWMDSAKSFNKSKPGSVPDELLPGLEEMEKGTLSTDDARDWLRKFFARMQKKKDSGLPKVWWEDVRPTYGGFTEDVANTKLLERYK